MSKGIGNDLSEGNVVKQLIMFSLPFLAANVIQSLYSVADMLIVGRFSGTASMSGVNIGSQVSFILTNLMFGLCAGGTILIGQYMGAKRQKDLEETVATLMTMLLTSAIVLTVVMYALQDPVLQMMKTPAEAYAESKNYLGITLLGLTFIFGYNIFSAIMRGMGDSKRPFYFVTIACVTNIILDLVFVGKLGMGASGAAIATVISQAVSMFTCVCVMVRSNFVFDFKPSSFRFYKDKLKRIISLGTPGMIQNGVTSFSFLIITVLVNVIGGYQASAAVGVVGKFNGFALMPAIAMSASISTIAAQSIGAGKWDRAVKVTKIGTIVGVAISVCIFVIAQAFPAQILALFNDSPEMIEYGIQYMRSFSFDYLIVPFVFCINGLFLGAGHTTFSMINNMLSAVILRVPASVIFGQLLSMGLFGIGLGAPVASFGSLVLIIGFLISGKWKTNKAM